MNWLKSLDDRVVDRARDSAAGYGQVASERRDSRSAGMLSDLMGPDVDPETLAPEVLNQLLQQARGRKAPEDVMNARVNLGEVLGRDGTVLPDDGTDASRQQIASMLQGAGIGAPADEGGAQRAQLAAAITQLRMAQNPGAGVRSAAGLAGVNQAIASNPMARGAAYGGIGAGVGLGGLGLTEAGYSLLELAGVLDSEDEQDTAEGQRTAAPEQQRRY